jgi:hypothetical protein
MSLSVDGAKAIVGLRPSEESRMKSTNASESRVSLGEPGAPVDSLRRCDNTDFTRLDFEVDSDADTQALRP